MRVTVDCVQLCLLVVIVRCLLVASTDAMGRNRTMDASNMFEFVQRDLQNPLSTTAPLKQNTTSPTLKRAFTALFDPKLWDGLQWVARQIHVHFNLVLIFAAILTLMLLALLWRLATNYLGKVPPAAQTAMDRICDIALDWQGFVTYLQGGYHYFALAAVSIIFFASTVSYISYKMCAEENSFGSDIFLHWTGIIHIQNARYCMEHNMQPGSEFLTDFIEFCLESAPESTMQAYTSMIGVGSDQYTFYFVSSDLMLQISTIFGLNVLGKEFARFSAEPFTKIKYTLDLRIRAFADVAVRVLGYAVLGAAMKDKHVDKHGFNLPLDCVIILGLLHCLQAVRFLAEEPFCYGFASIVSALVCFICQPPAVLKGLQPAAKFVHSARVVEMLAMVAFSFHSHAVGKDALFAQPMLLMLLVPCLFIYVFDTVASSYWMFIGSFVLFIPVWASIKFMHLFLWTCECNILRVIFFGFVLVEGLTLLMLPFALVKVNLGVATAGIFVWGIIYLCFIWPQLVDQTNRVMSGADFGCEASRKPDVVVMERATACLVYLACVEAYLQLSWLYEVCIGRSYTELPLEEDEADRQESGGWCTCRNVQRMISEDSERRFAKAPIFGAVAQGQVWLFEVLATFTPMAAMLDPETGSPPFVRAWEKEWKQDLSTPRKFINRFGELGERNVGDELLFRKYLQAGIGRLLDEPLLKAFAANDDVVDRWSQRTAVITKMASKDIFVKLLMKEWDNHGQWAAEAGALRSFVSPESKQVQSFKCVAKTLLENRANANDKVSDQALLAMACGTAGRINDTSLVELLLEYKAEPDNATSPNGEKLLVHALGSGEGSCPSNLMELLLKHKADPNTQNRHGERVLSLVTKSVLQKREEDRDLVPIELLLEKRASVIDCVGRQGDHLLCSVIEDDIGAQFTQDRLLKLFLEHRADPVNAKSQQGTRVLALAVEVALRHGNEEAQLNSIQLLFEYRAIVDDTLRDGTGEKVLVAAVMHGIQTGEHEATTLLLDRHANPDVTNKNNQSVLSLATRAGGKGAIDALRYLLESHARVDQVFWEDLWSGDLPAPMVVTLLIQKSANPNWEVCHQTKQTALHKAAQQKNRDLAQLLVQCGADKNALAHGSGKHGMFGGNKRGKPIDFISDNAGWEFLKP